MPRVKLEAGYKYVQIMFRYGYVEVATPISRWSDDSIVCTISLSIYLQIKGSKIICLYKQWKVIFMFVVWRWWWKLSHRKFAFFCTSSFLSLNLHPIFCERLIGPGLAFIYFHSFSFILSHKFCFSPVWDRLCTFYWSSDILLVIPHYTPSKKVSATEA